MVQAALATSPAIRTDASGLSIRVRQNAAQRRFATRGSAGARASATAASATGATSAILGTAQETNAMTTAAAVNDAVVNDAAGAAVRDAVVNADGEQGDGGNWAMGVIAITCRTGTATLANVRYVATDDAAIGSAAVKQNGGGRKIGAKIVVVAETC